MNIHVKPTCINYGLRKDRKDNLYPKVQSHPGCFHDRSVDTPARPEVAGYCAVSLPSCNLTPAPLPARVRAMSDRGIVKGVLFHGFGWLPFE